MWDSEVVDAVHESVSMSNNYVHRLLHKVVSRDRCHIGVHEGHMKLTGPGQLSC